MTKKFSCGEVVDGCTWSTQAQTDEDLFRNIAEHAKSIHGITEIPVELLQKVKSKIHDG